MIIRDKKEDITQGVGKIHEEGAIVDMYHPNCRDIDLNCN